MPTRFPPSCAWLAGAALVFAGAAQADTSVTRIHEIQGNGPSVTGAGPFMVEAIVVGAFQAQGSG